MIMEISLCLEYSDISYITREMIDKQIPNSYAQIQVKTEAYNKIVKIEFLAIYDSPNIVDNKQRYDMFVKAYWLDNVESGGGKVSFGGN
jgi:hypothetical protein